MKTYNELVKILTELDDENSVDALCQELFTTKELKDITLRWQLLKELYEGSSQRSIASKHKISLCKITRGSKILKKDDSVTLKLLKKYYPKEKDDEFED